MKVLFFDSRTQTRQWDRVALGLEKRGYTIYWIVVSPVILPTIGHVYRISYPSKTHLNRAPLEIPSLQIVRDSDRMVQYYGGNTEHYHYYWTRISEEIDRIQPDVVFGELANFHTHLGQQYCKQIGIPFFQPSTSRYPLQRFAFFYDDRPLRVEIGAIGENRRKVVKQTIQGIIDANVKPDYMKKFNRIDMAKFRVRQISFKMRLMLFYVLGDHYNIPNPLKVFRNTKRVKKHHSKWKKKAESFSFEEIKGKKVLLFPLQMQPEFNLDVWGRQYRKQDEVVKKIAHFLPNDWVLIIKPNPKSFLELTEEMIDNLELNNVFALPHDSTMPDALKHTDAIITATGTVAIEASVRKKHVFSLVKTDFIGFSYVHDLSDIREIAKIDRLIAFKEGEENQDIIDFLYRTSFDGVIGEEITDPACLDKENIDKLTEGFTLFLEYLKCKKNR